MTNTVKSLSQQEFFLIEVIAMTLRYLKDKLLSLQELARGLTGAMKASDFNWVITVPAMWKARGKQMMREAAYLVRHHIFIAIVLVTVIILYIVYMVVL